MFDTQRWQRRLDDERTRHRVPGASLAVLVDDEIHELATGVLHRGTGVAATTDALFQIGSITKPYTASLIMGLGIDIDQRVIDVLPDFRVADAEATATVTIRQLLTHSSGIDGDFFHDTGRGDDCVRKYVEACKDLRQNHPPGATMSYCNSGFVILGRIVEVVTGKVWDTALRDRLTGPLGLTSTVTLPEEVLRFRAAMGHVGTDPEPARVWGLPRSCGPAGLICATAADAVRFARMHLHGGQHVLTADAVAAMQNPEVEVPDPWSAGRHRGLGWGLFDWPGGPVFGHGGNTIGQSSFLCAVPAANVATVLLTNGGGAKGLYRTLFGELLDDLAGVTMPVFEPRESNVDGSAYVGRYERESIVLDVTEEANGLRLRAEETTEIDELNSVEEMDLLPVSDGVFAGRRHESEPWTPVVFFTLPDGTPYVHTGARATRKII